MHHKAMISRQRVLTAMRHEEPDRVPLFYRDVPEVRERLLRDLHLNDFDELLMYFGIDFRWVEPEYIGPPLENKETGIRQDIWGIEYKYVPFSETAGYWEALSRPLMNCTKPEELNDYVWPSLDWFDFSVLAEQVRKYDDYALMTAPGYASPGIIQVVEVLCGEEKAWTDIIANQTFFLALIRKILDFLEPFVDRMLEAARDRIDFFRIGDDYGSQQNLIVGPRQWRKCVQPALKVLKAIAAKHGAFYYHHSCGAIRKLIPDLIETGVDVLDPVQVSATGMIPAELKAEFGDQLVFSGGVDESRLLPQGSPDDVRAEVFQLLEDMTHGGGFLIGPTHNFQDDIPTENVIAMYQAAREWSC